MVRETGLDQWFEQQLHPASMEYADLNRRLNQFPSMRLPTQELLTAFPSGAMIRQAADGKLPVPNTPILRAVYSDQIAFYKEREARKAEKKAGTESTAASGKEAMRAAATSLPASPKTSPSSGSMNESMMSSSDAQPNSNPMSSSAMTPSMMASPRDSSKAKTAGVPAVGPSPEDEVLALLALPPEQRVRRMLAMSPPQLEEFRAAIKGPQRMQLLDKMTAGQREIVADLENPGKAVVDELTEQRLTRDLYSPAQLQEVMTDFWLNHFNVYLHKNEETPYYLMSFERDVIRPRALGKFEDLLVATAESPAMLLYLDNSSSMGPDSIAANKDRERATKQNKPAPPSGLNENYARELMELHTLGVNGGYTQQDVTEMARIFTGWTVSQPAHGGGFLFDERKHEPGDKHLLGMKVKDSGQKEGLEMLHILAMRPATARFLSRKLAIRFVTDDPPQSLVNRMAKSYLASGGDVAAVLWTMFHSPEFWQRDVYRAKVKTPLEYVVSAVRASNSETGNPMQLAYAVDRMGMPLYGCVPPTGYSSKAEAWVSTGALVNRMNFALALAANKLAEIHTGWLADSDDGDLEREVAREVVADPAQADEVADEHRLESRLVPGGISERTRVALLEQAASPTGAQSASAVAPEGISGAPASPAKVAQVSSKQIQPPKTSTAATSTSAARERRDALLAGLLLGSPEFQRR
jgi:uncharacterized protein (DUF1800 family)